MNAPFSQIDGSGCLGTLDVMEDILVPQQVYALGSSGLGCKYAKEGLGCRYFSDACCVPYLVWENIFRLVISVNAVFFKSVKITVLAAASSRKIIANPILHSNPTSADFLLRLKY